VCVEVAVSVAAPGSRRAYVLLGRGRRGAWTSAGDEDWAAQGMGVTVRVWERGRGGEGCGVNGGSGMPGGRYSSRSKFE